MLEKKVFHEDLQYTIFAALKKTGNQTCGVLIIPSNFSILCYLRLLSTLAGYFAALLGQVMNMIKGIGVDLVEISRVRKLLEQDNGFVERIFTAREISYCESKYFKAQHYGTGFRDGMSWQDVEVENDELGKPQLLLAAVALEKFKNKKLKKVLLSLSHTKDMAVALVVIE
jgi:holo-[acyl-carrier protein] synthase